MAEKDTKSPATGPSAGAAGLALGSALVVAGLVAIVAYAGEAVLAAMSLICVDGGVAALWVLSAAGVGVWLLRPLRLEGHPALRFATAAGAGLGVYSLAILALGLMGWWNRPIAWVFFFGGLVLGIIALRWMMTARPAEQADPVALTVRWVWVIAGLSWGTMLLAGALPPGLLWKPLDPHPYDVLSYHLQVPREWYELGRIAGLEHNVFSYFPMGVEMHFLAGMELMGGAWKGMYFAQFFTGAMAMVTALGVYGATRTLAPESRLLPTLAGVTTASTPWLIMLGSVAYTETGLLMYATLAVGWLLVGMGASGGWKAFVVGGAMAGFACGTKYTAVPMVLLGAPVAAVVAVLISRLHRRNVQIGRAIGGGAIFAIAGLVLFAPWLARNVAWTGNPVFPLMMPMLGAGHFTPEQVERFNVAHMPTEADAPLKARANLLATRIVWDWQYGYVLPLAGLVLGCIAWRDVRAMALVVLVLIVAGIWIGFTHLQGRFATVMIPMLGMLIGLAPPMVWTRLAGSVVLAVVAISGWVQISQVLEPTANIGRQGFFGIGDLSVFMPEAINPEDPPKGTVALVGDARAYVYTIPMERLRYRTAFAIKPANHWLDAWAGADQADLIVIDPNEWHRLWKTYRHIPPLPDQFQRPVTILMERQKMEW